MTGWKWTPLLPLFIAQGWWVRKKTPRLPDAAGPVEGIARPDRPAVSSSPIELIVLGESTVAGIGAPTHEAALTGCVAGALAKTAGREVRWYAVGLSGATAAIATRELVPRLKGRQAHAVVIALGVNDSISSALHLNADGRWRKDLRQLIAAIRCEVGNARILISGAPPLNRFPAFPRPLRFFLGDQSARLDRVSRQLVEEIPEVVFTPMLDGLNESHFCEDKFHPGAQGYAAWGEHLVRSCGRWLAGQDLSR